MAIRPRIGGDRKLNYLVCEDMMYNTINLFGLCLTVLGAIPPAVAVDLSYTFNPPIGICTSVNNGSKMQPWGYDYIESGVKRLLVPQESDAQFQENLQEAKQSPLPIYSYNGFIPGSLKSTGPDADPIAVLAYAETAFRRAQQVGSQVIVFGSGGSRGVPEGFSYEKATQQFTALLMKMGPIAARYDITVVIEPLNRGECNFINTVTEGTAIARAVNHPNIRVLADFYHMLKEDEGPQSILDAGFLLAHCHIAEEEGRRAPGSHGENFVPYLLALKQIHYSGRISIECRWSKGAAFDKELPTAIAYLRGQIVACQ
ncbi:sugar phosphate isomerase/epimerase family protein [Planctomycetota bacterium]